MLASLKGKSFFRPKDYILDPDNYRKTIKKTPTYSTDVKYKVKNSESKICSARLVDDKLIFSEDKKNVDYM